MRLIRLVLRYRARYPTARFLQNQALRIPPVTKVKCSTSLPTDVTLKSRDDDILFGDDVLHQVPDRNETDQLAVNQHGQMTQPLFRHHRHTFLGTLQWTRLEAVVASAAAGLAPRSHVLATALPGAAVQRAREAEDACLGSGVMRHVWRALVRELRACVDDATPLAPNHSGQDRARAQEDAAQVHADHVVPHLGRHAGNAASTGDECRAIVDPDKPE
jgi:hypothetical protein